MRNIINFVVNYDRPASEGVAVTMSQLIDFLSECENDIDVIGICIALYDININSNNIKFFLTTFYIIKIFPTYK